MKNLFALSEKALNSLNRGAVLVSGKQPNLMTIGWGSVGVMWRRPIFVIPVRFSRYSHELMEAGDECTVCFPKPGEMGNVISTCGSKSGREIDKVKETKVKLAASNIVSTPYIEDSGIVFECKVLFKTDMDNRGFLDRAILEGMYPDGDFHTLYFAEVLDAYEK